MDAFIKEAEYALRNIRKNFMVAAIKEGCALLDHLQKTDTELMSVINTTFAGQTARAAFWLTNERDSCGLTPLQQLAKGARMDVEIRLKHYTKPRNRIMP